MRFFRVDIFGESKPGDAMIVMAYDLEGNHGANAKKVAKALEDHHVRMFGLALGLVGTKECQLWPGHHRMGAGTPRRRRWVTLFTRQAMRAFILWPATAAGL